MNASSLHVWWAQRDTREKTLIAIAAALVTLALVWRVAVAPALQTLRQFDSTRAKQESQLQTLRALQAQAQSLQAQPPLSTSAATQALKTATEKAFGTQADLTLGGGMATVNLRQVSPEALAQWLTAARNNAHASPQHMRITRSTTGNTTGWSGSVQLALP